MVRINLLKQASTKKQGGRFPTVIVAGVIVAVVVVVAVVGILTRGAKRPVADHAAVVAAAPKPAIVPEKPVVKQPVAEKRAVPETTAVKQPAKKAVAAVSAVAPSAPPAVPKPSADQLAYNGMAQPGKNLYEMTFAGKLFKKLPDAVPEAIRFGALSVDSFATISGIGLGPTREVVSTLFSNLRMTPFTLLELPDSYIEADPSQGYRFQFVCRVSFPEDQSSQTSADGRLAPYKKLPSAIKSFTKIVTHDGLYGYQGLSRKAIKKTGKYRQSLYHLSCSGTYRNFVKCVLDLDKAGVPCAMTAVRIKARSETIVDISADIVFTTRD